MISSALEVLAGSARWSLFRGEALGFLQSLPDASVDAIVADAPYSSGGATRGDRMAAPGTKYTQTGTHVERPDFAGDNRDQRAFGYWCALWLSECLRVAKPGAPIALFTDWRQLPTTTDALQAGGWVWRGIVAWDKTDAARPAMGRFSNQCEYVVWGSAGAMPDRLDVGCLRGVVRHYQAHDDKHHVTGKPIPVMEAIVRIADPGGVILDPFAGSGTTGVAALRQGRRFIGAEITEGYDAIARERLAAEVAGVDYQAFRGGQTGLFR